MLLTNESLVMGLRSRSGAEVSQYYLLQQVLIKSLRDKKGLF